MKQSLLVRLAALLLSASAVAAKCKKPFDPYGMEPAFHIDVVKQLAARGLRYNPTNPPASYDPSVMGVYDLVAIHTNAAPYVHGVAEFYPFHRGMVFIWEKMLQSAGWSWGAVYFDWSAVSQNWPTSNVFNYFGHQSTGSNPCLRDGLFQWGKYKVSPVPAWGSGAREYDNGGDHWCLRRCGYTDSALDDPLSIAAATLRAKTYSGFRSDDSVGYHANGHIIIGGGCDLGNFYSSPNDPLFYLHHTFIDKNWWKWQNLCPEYKNDYEGTYVVSDGNVEAADPNQPLHSWGPYTVRQMLDTLGGDPLCYTYTKSAGDITNFGPPRCPSGAAANTKWPFGQPQPRRPSAQRPRPSPPTRPDAAASLAVGAWSQVALEPRDGGDSSSSGSTSTSTSGGQMAAAPGLDAGSPTTPQETVLVTIPRGYRVHRILYDRVLALRNDYSPSDPLPVVTSNTTTTTTTADPPILVLHVPTTPAASAKAKTYVRTGRCNKKDRRGCLAHARTLTREEVERFMMRWDGYQAYLAKTGKAVDECNASDGCQPISTRARVLYEKNGNWEFLKDLCEDGAAAA
ncbi:hypothetical protein DFJ73DRAFT_803378 [Zopfochytrium polystomum]|nr:hypothetical protein DFJ73DRAFT_803378 [Zopfochytrium polystomum]